MSEEAWCLPSSLALNSLWKVKVCSLPSDVFCWSGGKLQAHNSFHSPKLRCFSDAILVSSQDQISTDVTPSQSVLSDVLNVEMYQVFWVQLCLWPISEVQLMIPIVLSLVPLQEILWTLTSTYLVLSSILLKMKHHNTNTSEKKNNLVPPRGLFQTYPLFIDRFPKKGISSLSNLKNTLSRVVINWAWRTPFLTNYCDRFFWGSREGRL